jgi:hypothetical protein
MARCMQFDTRGKRALNALDTDFTTDADGGDVRMSRVQLLQHLGVKSDEDSPS